MMENSNDRHIPWSTRHPCAERRQPMNAVLQFLQSHIRPIGIDLHRVEPGDHGPPSEDARSYRGVAEQEISGADFRVGLGGGAGVRLSDHQVLPLAEPYVVVVFLASLAPVAPFLQQMVAKARGDMGFAGALIPLVTVGTVVLMPLMAPLLIKGVTHQHLVARETAPPDHPPAADHRSGDPALRRQGRNQDIPGGQGTGPALHTADDLWCLVIYGRGMLNTAGNFAFLHDPVHGRDGPDDVSASVSA